MKHNFTNVLLTWYNVDDRPLPWKKEKDPYLIWLSEIILQQTRVEQGLPYYNRFKETFPTVNLLANAPEDQVLKLWQGLGYYSRARNLHAASKMVMNDFAGVFPASYKDVIKLKGVGEYTAAAIASFALNEPYAVVDGNVYRVLSRFFGIDTPIDSTAGKKLFASLANELLPDNQAALFNQAIMDFGATVCKPSNPLCSPCPMAEGCIAYRENSINELPQKSKKLNLRERFFHYFVITNNEFYYLRKRTTNDIWQNLYEFPMIESNTIMTRSRLIKDNQWKKWFKGKKIRSIKHQGTQQQKLSHQKINAVFYEIILEKTEKIDDQTLITVKRENLNNFAFPKMLDCYLEDKTLYLNL